MSATDVRGIGTRRGGGRPFPLLHELRCCRRVLTLCRTVRGIILEPELRRLGGLTLVARSRRRPLHLQLVHGIGGLILGG